MLCQWNFPLDTVLQVWIVLLHRVGNNTLMKLKFSSHDVTWFFLLKCSVLFSPCISVGTNPTEVGGVGLGGKEEKKTFSAPPSHLGNYVVEKNLSKRKNTFPVDQFLDPVCQAQELVLTQRRAGAQAGRRVSTASFGGIIHFNPCHRKHLHCFWRLQLVRMVQIIENFCLQGQTSPLDTCSESSVWKWLEQINDTEFFLPACSLKT